MIPNHILIVGGPHSGKLRLAQFILGLEDIGDVSNDTHSGMIVKTELKTEYYASQLNIFIDEYPENRQQVTGDVNKIHKLQEWFAEFGSDECKELREVLDGFIFTVDMDSQSPELISQHMEVVSALKELFDSEEDVEFFCLVVGVSSTKKDYVEFEDIAIQNGLEFVYFNEAGLNEFKDKIGRDRIMEVLQSHEWKNMDLVSGRDYRQHKIDRMKDEMTQSLMGHHEPQDRNVDFTYVLEKLKIAKEESGKIDNEEQKKAYVNGVIDELVDYI